MTYRERWRAEIAELQAILSGFDLKEERKWGKPTYTMDGTNVVIIQDFRDYCALGFLRCAAEGPEEAAGAARAGSGRPGDEIHRRRGDHEEDAHHQGLFARSHGGGGKPG